MNALTAVNAVIVTVTMSALHNRGNGMWEAECHDCGQRWWTELNVPGDWRLIRKETVIKGNLRRMGTYLLIFVSPEVIEETRNRIEALLRKEEATESVLKVAYCLGLYPALNFGLTDDETY